MVKLIMGLSGSGKTKTLLSLVQEAIATAQGDVVCIEKDKNLTYDVPYQARLIHTSEYGINSNELLSGFLLGLHAGNYDITHVFVDNFYKLVEDKSPESFDAFIAWLDKFSEAEKIEFVISVSADAETASESVKKHFI